MFVQRDPRKKNEKHLDLQRFGRIQIPDAPCDGIFAYIYHELMVNPGKYIIYIYIFQSHGAIWEEQRHVTNSSEMWCFRMNPPK